MTVLKSQKGAALLTAIVILALLTIIGMAATNTSMLETMISGTEKSRVAAFYAAEAGVEHLRRNLKELYLQHNKNKNISDQNWNFALDGSINGETATGQDYQGGARLIEDGDLNGNYKYNVFVWNNKDGGTATSDIDKVIHLRADAQVPGGGSASIEILLLGDLTDVSPIGGYGAQEGGGSGKNYTASDVDTVDTSSSQIQ